MIESDFGPIEIVTADADWSDMGQDPAERDGRERTCWLVRNEAAVITAVDESITEVLGWRPEQLLGSPSTALIHPNDHASAVGAWFAMINAPGSTRTWQGRYLTAQGEWCWIQTVNTNRLDDPQDPGVFTLMRLATENDVSLDQKLRAREELIVRLTDALPVGVFQVNGARRVLFTNGQLHRILESPPAADVAGQFAVLTEDDRGLLDMALESVLAGQEVDGLELHFTVAVPHPDFASTRVCEASLRPLTDGMDNVTGVIGCLSDVTDSVELRRELELRASTDMLTGCLNRTATFELLDRSMRTRGETSTGVAVIFVDMDHFKSINDRLGHAAGDRALITAAECMRKTIRAGDALGRIGGDEFLVVCPAVTDPDSIVALARRVGNGLQSHVDAEEEKIQLAASVGIAWSNDLGESADSLIARADAAMYQSKLSGVGTVVVASAPS